MTISLVDGYFYTFMIHNIGSYINSCDLAIYRLSYNTFSHEPIFAMTNITGTASYCVCLAVGNCTFAKYFFIVVTP